MARCTTGVLGPCCTAVRHNLADQRIEMGALDERVLRLEEGVGGLSRQRLPLGAERGTARVHGGEPDAPGKARLRDEARDRAASGSARHLIAAVRAPAGI